MSKTYNKGEWSELYAFVKLLKEGRVYAADANACKIPDVYLPIIKLIREEQSGSHKDFFTGDIIKIYENGEAIKTISAEILEKYITTIFPRIFTGARSTNTTGAFAIPEAEALMEDLTIQNVKASSTEKVDISMQIHDVNTGFKPEVGFSVKSDVGSAPTLLNPGKNTRFRYCINGISDEVMCKVNAIDKNVCREYMKARMEALLSYNCEISYDSMLDDTYEDNLMMIDSALPQIYGEIILQHYKHISEGIYNCTDLLNLVENENPMGYRRPDIYTPKFKKLLCASALGMTPGKAWDGTEAATGGYIIIKKDGDVLCYHIYNRNFFEEYLMNNTRLDRPSASRYDYGYIYKDNDQYYIDLNVQVRFKTIG